KATPDEAEALKHARLAERLKALPAGADTPLAAVYHEAGGTRTRSMPPREEMEAFILGRMEISDADLQALANRRARVVQEGLVRNGADRERLLIQRANQGVASGPAP